MNAFWRPTTFLRYEGCSETSTGVARILTDAGKAYIKALGNKEGPHALAREWVGTRLAGLLGLPTFDFAIFRVGETDEIPLGHGRQALPGPAFVSRECAGYTWGGDKKGLQRIVNPGAVTRLIVLDTWLRNMDRCPPAGSTRGPNHDNVFLSSEDVP